jgi:multidrug efflux pump
MVISSIDSYETIFQVMNQIKAEAAKSGLFAFQDSDLDYNTPTYTLKIDRSKANDLGVTMQSISNTLAAMVGENYVNRFALNGRSYEVIPQVARAQRLNSDELTKYYVTTASGAQIPLSTIVSIENGTGPNALVEYNQLNSATFSAVPFPGVTQGQAVAFLEDASKRLLPAGFNHSYLSESRQYVEEGNALVVTFGFALLIIYLVLAAQFESLRDPLVILVSVPMSICGALIPLYFGDILQVPGATVNIYSQVGLVTLIGLISKHGILMVTFANDMQRNELVDRRTAIQHAARIRLGGCRQPRLHRHRHRQRHDDRHPVHPVRSSGGLYPGRPGPPRRRHLPPDPGNRRGQLSAGGACGGWRVNALSTRALLTWPENR